MVVHISTNTTTGIDVITDGETYILDPGISVSATGIDNAFFGAASFTGNTIRIQGTAESTDGAAILFKGKNTKIDIDNAGAVTATNQTAIRLEGNNSSVVSDGEINAAFFGIQMLGTGATVTNNDTITSAGTGIRFDGANGHIENQSGATVSGVVGVNGESATGTFSLVNFGTITGSVFAFDGSAATDTVTNRGTMNGDIILRGGNDSIDTIQGTVSGSILGGAGNDTYKVANAGIALVELASEGTDKIVSTVSYVLKANFETLQLSGAADINGKGTSKADTLIGNSGDNKLLGLGGSDHLAGGKGDDILTGGTGRDTFVFANNMGLDRVTDFVATGTQHDFIDLRAVSAIDNFADLKANFMSRDGSDVVIEVSSGNVIRIEDVTLNSLKTGDFLF